MKTVYITQKAVEDLVKEQGPVTFMQTAIEKIESGLTDFKDGRVEHDRRVGFLFDGNTVEAMPARRKGKHIAFKIVNFHQHASGSSMPSVMSTTMCIDEATGAPLAIIESTPLTALRTGAVSGIAIKYLFPGAKTIGLIGAGAAGQSSLQAACLVAEPETIYVYDVKPEAVSRLSTALDGFSHPTIYPADLETVVRKSDVVIACTYGDQIVVEQPWVGPELKLVISVGSDTPGKNEIEPVLYKGATIVTDFKEQAIAEGDIELPIKQGIITADSIDAELHEIVAGKSIDQKPLTIFDSTGDPISDMIMAEIILAK